MSEKKEVSIWQEKKNTFQVLQSLSKTPFHTLAVSSRIKVRGLETDSELRQ